MMTGTAFSLDHTATPPNHAERPAPCRSRGDARFRPWRRARPRSLRPRRRYRPADWCCRPAPATGTDRRVPRTATRCAPRDATSRRRGSMQTEGRGCASRSIPHSGSNTRRGKHDCRLSHHEMPNRSFMAGVLPQGSPGNRSTSAVARSRSKVRQAMDAAGTAYLSGWLPLGLLPVRHGSMCPFEAFEQLFTAPAGWYGARNAPLGAASPATSIAAVYRPGP